MENALDDREQAPGAGIACIQFDRALADPVDELQLADERRPSSR